MEVGSAAEWVSGICTGLATLAAVFAGALAHRAYRRETSRDRQSLAAGVHAWIAWDIAESSGGQRLIVSNLSSAPIYDTQVEFTMYGIASTAPGRGKAWYVLPPGQYMVMEDERYIWSLPDPIHSLQQFRPYARSEKHLVTTLSFTDARGARWRRDHSGQLEEVPPPATRPISPLAPGVPDE
ncbi:hypothetical protein GCM10023066_12580 [Nocardioides kongjuensis]